MDTSVNSVNTAKHKKYFLRCLQVLPGRYCSLDTTRMTIVFFSLSGLDLLYAQDLLDKDKVETIQFIYALQILPNDDDSNLHLCGFRGSTTIGSSFDGEAGGENSSQYDSSHVAMTYTSLLSLLILGDDLSGVNRRGVVAGLRHLQLKNGSFCATPDESENDMRFVYCASCVSHILDDWDGVDIDRAVQFIIFCQTYEGSFAQGPGLEGHGGSTFCAVASLVLMGRLQSALSTRRMNQLKRWCLLRQQSGFQGRPNKPVDTCYSFWVGATLKLLEIQEQSSAECNRGYLMTAEDQLVGGFSKWPDTTPDPMHSYLGLCGLSLIEEQGIRDLHPALNVSNHVAARLEEIHARWRSQHSDQEACGESRHIADQGADLASENLASIKQDVNQLTIDHS